MDSGFAWYSSRFSGLQLRGVARFVPNSINDSSQSSRNKARSDNKALDAEPPIASFMKSMLTGGGPVNSGSPSRVNADYSFFTFL